MMFFVCSPKDSFRGQAIGIPLERVHQVRKVEVLSAGLALHLKNASISYFLLSAHLPHTQREDVSQVWNSMMQEIRNFTCTIRVHDTLILGCDANYELSADLPNTHVADDRKAMWNLLRQDLGLQCTCPEIPTWTNTTGAASRIDFICYRTPRPDTFYDRVIWDSDQLLGTDHRAVAAAFRSIEPVCRVRQRPQHRCGKWRVNNAQALEELGKIDPATFDAQDDLSRVARQVTFRGSSCRYRDSKELRDLIQQRKRATGSEARRLAHEIVQRRAADRRQWMEDILARSANGDFAAISFLKKKMSVKASHGAYVQRAGGEEQAIKDLRTFYARKYTPKDPVVPGLPQAMYLQRAGPLQDAKPLELEEIQILLAGCKHGKSTGRDGIPYELLQVLLQTPLQCEFVRYLDDVLHQRRPIPLEWTTGQITLIPKIPEPRNPKDLRPICLSACVGKLFTKLLWTRIRAHAKPPRAFQLSGISGSQCIDGAAAVQHALRLSQEWGKPLIALKVDISQAFDTLRHEAVAAWLATLGGSVESLVLLRMITDTTVNLHFGQMEWEQKLHQGLLQGSPYSAELFSRVLDWHVGFLYQTWQDTEDTWLVTEGFKLFCVMYADDLVLLAENHDQMQRMVTQLQTLLATIGLSIAVEKCKYLQSPDLPERDVTVSSKVIPCVSTFVFLGVLMGFGVQCSDVIAHRLAGASNAFHGYYSILTRAVSSVRKRLQLLNTFVTSKWRWMAPCVRPVQAVKDVLDKLHTTMLSSICRLREDVFIGAVGNWVAKRRASRMIAQLCMHAKWSGIQAQAFFKYWGHVARRDLTSPTYLVLQVYSTKWQWVDVHGHRRTLGFWPNSERLLQLAWQQHRKPHQHRDWQTHAQDRQAWVEFTEEWLQAKGLKPSVYYLDLHGVDLCGRMLLQTGDSFRLLPMRHVPVEPPYPSSLQILQEEEVGEGLERDSVHTIRFVTDGSCTGGRGGWAVVVATPYVPAGQASVCYGKVPGKSTNIRAEITAIGHALKLIKELRGAGILTPVQLWTDSLFAIHILQDVYSTALNASEVAAAQQLWLEVGGSVHLQHVPAHKGIALNEIADKFAKLGAGLSHFQRVFQTQDFRKAYVCRDNIPAPPVWRW